MRSLSIAAGVAAAVLSFSIAPAQSQRSDPPGPSPATRSDCTPGLDNPRPPANETTGSRPLSERLAEGKGVICPPAGIDPGLTVPPIGGGRTPVIPPPGTPGGNPGIQPR